jgi:hypothetical protein
METGRLAESERLEASGGPWHRLYLALAVIAAALPWVPRWDATQDGPQHIRLSAFVIEMRSDAASPLHAVYHDSLGLVTGSLFTWFSYLLHPLASVDTAGRLWLSLTIAGFAWVGWLISRTAHPEAPARALLLAPFFVNGLTTYGFFPYLGSVPLAAGSVWLLASPKARAPDWLRHSLAAVLLIVTCLSHVSSLVIAFGTSLAIAVARRRSLRDVLVVLVVFTPAILVALHSTRVLDVALSTHQSLPDEGIETMNPVETAVRALMYAQAGVWVVDRVAQIVALGLALVLIGAAIASLVQPSKERGDYTARVRWPSTWPLGLLALLLAALFTLPARLSGFTHANGRIVPFVLLLIPACAWWPKVGSVLERRLAAGAAAAAVIAFVGIGYGWLEIGRHLDSVASAAKVIEPGTRVLPLVFEAGPDASAPVRARGSGGLHAWAIAARLRHSMVSFGFENMRRLMVVARADAHPPFPKGPDEFAARVLWGPRPKLARVFADYGPYMSDITDDARFLAPSLAEPGFFDAMRDAVLEEAREGFHYLLAIDPPPAFLETVRGLGWRPIHQEDGVYVYRLGLGAGVASLPYKVEP